MPDQYCHDIVSATVELPCDRDCFISEQDGRGVHAVRVQVRKNNPSYLRLTRLYSVHLPASYPFAGTRLL